MGLLKVAGWIIAFLIMSVIFKQWFILAVVITIVVLILLVVIRWSADLYWWFIDR